VGVSRGRRGTDTRGALLPRDLGDGTTSRLGGERRRARGWRGVGVGARLRTRRPGHRRGIGLRPDRPAHSDPRPAPCRRRHGRRPSAVHSSRLDPPLASASRKSRLCASPNASPSNRRYRATAWSATGSRSWPNNPARTCSTRQAPHEPVLLASEPARSLGPNRVRSTLWATTRCGRRAPMAEDLLRPPTSDRPRTG
jgi:hypothetical protein